jgi:hypothetical protein
MALVDLIILFETQWRHDETLARASAPPRRPAAFFSIVRATIHGS